MPALGSTPGIIVGVGVGAAASTAIQPALEIPRQEAWKRNAHRLIPVAQLAALIAQGGVPLGDDQYDEAAREGFGRDKLDALIYLAQTVPGFGEAVRVLRRDPTFAGLFEHSLTKQGIDARYHKGLADLQHERLDPAVIALAIVRGIMADPGFLPVGPPTREGRVKAFPTSDIPTLEEARAAGWDDKRLFVQTAISGRPMGPEAAAAAVFRDILARVDYDRAISEGDIRNEWADAIFETARQIPSVADYVNARIRGWITEKEMHDGVARHGMSPEDADLLYLRTGRPAAPGQMATAAARGIDGPDGRPMDRPQFLKGIAESDIRPEWGPMLWESRFLYPPLFQITRLVQAGAIDADTAAEWARKDRYPPEVVTALHAYWLTLGGGTAEDPRVKLATSQAFAALKRAFMREQMDDSGVLNGLQTWGMTQQVAAQILERWTFERLWTEKPLTPAAIKKGYKANELSIDEAVARLVAQQWSAADANIYLTT